ncbi:hypothetical protein HID58_095536 [Brassica napus]|uniref:Disease resistance protein n=1 Tax=Brassica napus TaxID=3708 RepID=A0ABQ7X4N9_BRANA|nr:hypothetical protein HID58_095536 [Brassica napus]
MGCKPEDIKLWIFIAVSRFLRELDVYYHDHPDKNNILPSSLYASKSLVILKLKGNILLDVPRMVGLPSLKTLQIQSVKLLDGESFRKIPSVCPVLGNLLVNSMVDLPQLEEAYLDFNYRDVERLIGSITSVKRLTLALELEHLRLCVGTNCASSLLVRLLEDSPNLRELDLFEMTHTTCLVAFVPIYPKEI